jgi:hypothetical protein
VPETTSNGEAFIACGKRFFQSRAAMARSSSTGSGAATIQQMSSSDEVTRNYEYKS